jgi:hypothetical protein
MVNYSVDGISTADIFHNGALDTGQLLGGHDSGLTLGVAAHSIYLGSSPRFARRGPEFPPLRSGELLQPQTVTTTGADGKIATRVITTQNIAQGLLHRRKHPKMLGTNGGGFFNANSAHPFENPTPFSNLLEMLGIFLIPAGLTVTLGRMTGSPGHGWAVFAAMAVLFFAGVSIAYHAESQPNPLLHSPVMHIDQRSTAMQAGGNMEGKEVRFGVANSALFATVTTDAAAEVSTRCTIPSCHWAGWCLSST